MKTATAKVRLYNAKHREDVWMLPGKVLLKIARAAVTESVCEDSTH